MAPLYKPPTKVTTTQTPYLSLVTAADPDWARYKHREPYFEGGVGRQIYFDPYISGSFNNHSGVYPVGQAYGADDPLVLAAKAPTVGNPVPGLYQGTPDGKGWA